MQVKIKSNNIIIILCTFIVQTIKYKNSILYIHIVSKNTIYYVSTY